MPKFIMRNLTTEEARKKYIERQGNNNQEKVFEKQRRTLFPQQDKTFLETAVKKWMVYSNMITSDTQVKIEVAQNNEDPDPSGVYLTLTIGEGKRKIEGRLGDYIGKGEFANPTTDNTDFLVQGFSLYKNYTQKKPEAIDEFKGVIQSAYDTKFGPNWFTKAFRSFMINFCGRSNFSRITLGFGTYQNRSLSDFAKQVSTAIGCPIRLRYEPHFNEYRIFTAHPQKQSTMLLTIPADRVYTSDKMVNDLDYRQKEGHLEGKVDKGITAESIKNTLNPQWNQNAKCIPAQSLQPSTGPSANQGGPVATVNLGGNRPTGVAGNPAKDGRSNRYGG